MSLPDSIEEGSFGGRLRPNSPDLQAFYNDICDWLLNKPNAKPFNSQKGICHNLEQWAKAKYKPKLRKMRQEEKQKVYDLGEELENQFIALDLDWETPFNMDLDHYCDECRDNTLYDNPQRRQWILGHANNHDLPKEGLEYAERAYP